MNATLKAKHEELTKLKVRGDTLLNETKTTGLTSEISLSLDAVSERIGVLRTEIDTETKLEAKKLELADLDRFINDPVHKVPHGINPDDDGRKALLKAGWESKGGFVYASTSLEGKTLTLAGGGQYQAAKQLMYPDEVLFGAIPGDDDKTADYYRKTRAIFAPEYRAAFAKHMKLAVKIGSEKMAFTMLEGYEQKALSEGSDASGGFIVPPDIQAEILAHLPQNSVMRANCRVQPTNRDVLKYPAAKANSGTYGGIAGSSIYSSGFIGSWSGETPAFSDTDPSFQTLDITIKKVRVATKLSNDFIADAATNVLAWLAQNGAENMALTEDFGFILGDGTALQPLGLINAGMTNVDIEGSSADTISNTTSAAGTAAKLFDVVYKLPSQYANNAKWIMRRTVEGKIRKLVTPAGNYAWPPFIGSPFAGRQTELQGFPILHSDWMPDDGQDTQPVVLLVDLSAYIIAQRTNITSMVLRERFADTDQTGIILFERIGGGMFNTDAGRGGIC